MELVLHLDKSDGDLLARLASRDCRSVEQEAMWLLRQAMHAWAEPQDLHQPISVDTALTAVPALIREAVLRQRPSQAQGRVLTFVRELCDECTSEQYAAYWSRWASLTLGEWLLRKARDPLPRNMGWKSLAILQAAIRTLLTENASTTAHEAQCNGTMATLT